MLVYYDRSHRSDNTGTFCIYIPQTLNTFLFHSIRVAKRFEATEQSSTSFDPTSFACVNMCPFLSHNEARG